MIGTSSALLARPSSMIHRAFGRNWDDRTGSMPTANLLIEEIAFPLVLLFMVDTIPKPRRDGNYLT